MYNIPMMKIQLVKEGKIPSESRPLIKMHIPVHPANVPTLSGQSFR